MFCNFPSPSTSQILYIAHGDVVTFFHEFGQTQFVRFSGTRAERDFIETSS